MRTLLFLLIGLFSLGSCAQQEMHEVVVIGGGLMGSATGWQLAHSGVPVLLLEQQDSVYTRGSSLGQTRITQKHSLSDDKWSVLHMRSLKETARLMENLDERYKVTKSYIMEDVYTTAIVTNIHPKDRLAHLRTMLERQDVDFKIAATPQEADDLFKMKVSEDEVVVREYGLYTGTLNPQALISHLHLGMHGLDSEIRYRSKVTALTRERGHFKIEVERTDSGEKEVVYAKRVVSAAGPYTGTLLSAINPNLQTLIDPQRVFQAFARLKSDTFNNLDIPNQVRYAMGFPVVSNHSDNLENGFISTIEEFENNGNPLLKVSGHHKRSSATMLDMVWDMNLSQEEKTFAMESLHRYIQKLGVDVPFEELEYVDGNSSVYSMTSSGVPYVTHIPDESGGQIDGLVMLAGMSGVGAEGAMAYGLIASNLLMEREADETELRELVPWLGFERLKKDLAGNAAR